MNHLLSIRIAVTALFLLSVHPLTGAATTPPPTANATNSFTISGMHCTGCARGLTAELQRAEGVVSATVSLTNQLAVVTYDTNRTRTATLVKVVEEAGFKARKATP